MAKKKPDTSFSFGANVQQGKKQPAKRRQTSSDRQAYAIARRTGQYGGS